MRKLRVGDHLLDIGAGSGILVEQALEFECRAQGIEPSKWLERTAVDRGRDIPHPAVCGPFGVITLIDVIEHVSNPVELLCKIRQALKQDGIAVIVTPDVSSIAARIPGWKWWDFRVAYIGYLTSPSCSRTVVLDFPRADNGLIDSADILGARYRGNLQ